MRKLLASVAAVILSAAALAAQAPQVPAAPQPPQVFRAGVEILTVDVTAIDNNTGRQVTDLTSKDFVVEVDGNPRQVATSEYVRSVDPMRVVGAPVKVAAKPDETFFSSNAKGAPSGRLIVILVDQGNIRTGAARSVMNSAKKFVDSLEPEDRVALIAVPGPGELVDFTIDHNKVRESLLRIVGQADPIKARFNISITEAMSIYMRSDIRMAAEVILRECGQAIAAAEAERCEREVEQDAAEIINDIRHRTQDSINGMRAVLKSIGNIEGPKSVILISEGLIFESLGSETDEIASVAADSRASLDILLLDVPRFDASQSVRPTTPREDRDLQVAGLEMLAGAARGTVYRVNTTAEFAFDRISRAIDGFYLLGVESRAEDRNGRRHRISVTAIRKGVTIRSRPSFLTSVSGKATTPADAVQRALKSPLPINDLPLKVATWTYKEPGTAKVRVLIAAEVERLAEQTLDYTAGMLLIDRNGRGMMPAITVKTLTIKDGDPGTAVFTGIMSIDPGQYRLGLAMSDSEGRIGSVSRGITAWQMNGAELAMGDLLIGSVTGADRANLMPAIEPAIAAGQMGALLEIYGGAAQVTGLEAALEILADENSQPLASVPMRIGAGPSPEIVTASAQFSTSALPPGRYLARGIVRQGGTARGHMIRPFRILADAPSLTGAPALAAPGALPAEMAMVLLGGLSPFDRKELLSPAMMAGAFAAADARAAGSKAALKEARGGDLGSAAMTALGDGDQALAAFLKGLELLQQSQLDRAAVQFQSSMQIAPAFAPARLYLGATLASADRHKEAAGLIQSGSPDSAPNAAVGRMAGEEWIKAGQPANAIAPLEQALKQANADAKTRQLLGVAYVLGGRPTEAVAVLTPYLDANPTNQPALLAAIFGTYIRHLNTPQPATLVADKANVAKWSKAYTAAKGPMQPLIGAWVKHLQGLR
ncbi:MAG: VWA domain-containing protein [Acidobacteriota bacterium]|nr:VWA domain-containing protein [Acidobacteriota bacterium]